MTSQPPRRGLGRGLGALIPTSDPETGNPYDETGPEPSVGAAPPAVPTGTAAPATGGAGTSSATEAGTASADEDVTDGVTGTGADNADNPGEADPESGLAESGAHFAELPLAQVTPNARQPRQDFDEEAMAELVHSVREIGLLQPVVVRRTGAHSYELVMGERRWRACREAGLATVPAIVRETEDSDMLRDALLENLHRSELNPLEEASAYGQLLEDFDCTHDELAQRLGRSRPQISNMLRLLKLSPAVQRRVAAGVLSAGHARSLLAVADADQQDRLAQRVVAEGISVRGLEEIVQVGDQGNGGSGRSRSTPSPPDPVGDEVASRLSDRLETRVKVDVGKTKGRITVEVASMEDLQRVADLIDPPRHRES